MRNELSLWMSPHGELFVFLKTRPSLMWYVLKARVLKASNVIMLQQIHVKGLQVFRVY